MKHPHSREDTNPLNYEGVAFIQAVPKTGYPGRASYMYHTCRSITAASSRSTTTLPTTCGIIKITNPPIRRLVLVPPYSVFCSISFRCGGLSIERNQKPLAPKITLAATHHDRQKQVEVKRSSRVNPHEIRLFSGCPYAVVKQGTKKFTKKISPTRVSVGSEPI